MEKRPNNGQSDDSEEIAAALAAVYALLAGEENAPLEPPAKRSPGSSAWGAASRMEAVRRHPEANKTDGSSLWRIRSAKIWATLILSSLLLTQAQSASALERIQYQPASNSDSQTSRAPAPAQQASSAQTSGAAPMRAGPQIQAEFSISQAAPSTIRILLGSIENLCEIAVPDGAEISEEKKDAVLAVLPPQSSWQLALPENGGNEIAFTGRLGNVRAQRVILATRDRYAGQTSPASFSKPGVFAYPPRTLNPANPRFQLPFKEDCIDLENKSNYQLTQNQTASAKITTPHVVPDGILIKAPEPDGILNFQGKSYRGALLLKRPAAGKKGFNVINVVDLEDYLLSVLPSEMPASWSIESLKAQCIAARSYALANLKKHGSEGYDLKANTEDQVYLGVQTENENSNRAVAETRGLVMKHDGKVVSAFFHSSGGGHTELAEHVWTKGVPYLKSVPDFDDQSPHFAWNRQVSVGSMEESLRKLGKDVGAILGIFPVSRTDSQRIQTAIVAGTLQTLIISGEELRKIMQLPSTVFNLGQAQDAYLIAGRGFGHGLGMSQWGAKYLAEQGYNAAQILSYYYKDVSIEHCQVAQTARASSGRQE